MKKNIFPRGRIPAIRWLAGLLLLIFLSAWSISYLVGYQSYLTMVHRDTGRLLFMEPLSRTSSFEVRYIHSVDRQPVYEVYKITAEEDIVLTETRFRMFGAGMGHFSGEGTLIYNEGWTIIKGLEREIAPLYLRVGYTSDLTLFVNEKQYNLSDSEYVGSLLVIRIEKMSGGELIKRGVSNKWANLQ